MKKSAIRIKVENGLRDCDVMVGDCLRVFNDNHKTFRRIKFCGISAKAKGKEKAIESHFLTLGLKVKVGHTKPTPYNFYHGLTIKVYP